MTITNDHEFVPPDLQRRISQLETDLAQLRNAVGKLGLTRQQNGGLLVPGGITLGGGNGGGAGIVIAAASPGAPTVISATAAASPPGGIAFQLTFPAGMGQESLQYWEVQTNVVATLSDPGWVGYTVNALNFTCPTPYSGTVHYRVRYVTNVGTFSGWTTGNVASVIGVGGAPLSYASSTFTPSWNSSSGDAALGAGSVLAGRYTLIGKMCIGWAFVSFGTSGFTKGTGFDYRIGCPIAARVPLGGLPTVTPFGVSTVNCSSGVVHHGGTIIIPGPFGLGSVFLHSWDNVVTSSVFGPSNVPGLVVDTGGAAWALGFAYETV